VTEDMKTLNCGITGGQRDIMLQFLTRMMQVLEDPALAIRQGNQNINLRVGEHGSLELHFVR